MANPKENWDTAVLRYVRACMLDKKEGYYTEPINTIKTFIGNNKSLASNGNIREDILKVMREDE